MKLTVKKTNKLTGEIEIPSSKSHTIRGVIIASLTKGTSKLLKPLDSADTKAAVNGCRALGAKITQEKDEWLIEGFAGKPKKPSETLNMLNSGTSINLLTSVAALGDFPVRLDGDSSLRKRPMHPLLKALKDLGAKVKSTNGCPPIEIQGPIQGGKTELECLSSQYLSSLLISCPLLKNNTEIIPKELCEIPYIEMTLKWLDEQKIKYEHNNMKHFKVFANQQYKPLTKAIPADWSSAAFPLVAAAITNSGILIKGLDINDTQGDKQITDYLKKMNANIKIEKSGIRISSNKLKGAELDLNKTPDALPAVSILGCCAEGTTIIKNVAHARVKETDRIKIMTTELKKMGADIKETENGLIIKKSTLKGTKVNGHHDHRVVMALSLAGLIASGKTEIETAEAVSVTFPNYLELMKKLGANMEVS